MRDAEPATTCCCNHPASTAQGGTAVKPGRLFPDLYRLCSDLSSELSCRLLGALQLLLHLLQHLPLHPHLLLQVLVSGLALAQGLLHLG